jgi:GNAT superfamily N-acetyltransferase
MTHALPQISFVGHPVLIPCAAHAGLGLRTAGPADSAHVLEHLQSLDAEDRRLRFGRDMSDAALASYVEELWQPTRIVLSAHEGPLWPGSRYDAGPIRGVAELSISGESAELRLSVDPGRRRQGVGTYLIQTAARLLAPCGVHQILVITLPRNRAMICLGQRCGARIEPQPEETVIVFSVELLHSAYAVRRLAGQVFWPLPLA